MYFDQYSITSLRYIDISFKNFMARNLAAGLYISAVSVPAGLICPACVSSVSILFLLPFRHPPFRFFLPFLIVGSAKVRIFFKLHNILKYLIIQPHISISLPSKRDAKVEKNPVTSKAEQLNTHTFLPTK
jgi:hypothetical protein